MARLLPGLSVCLLQRLAQWTAAQGWHDTSIGLFHSCLGVMQQLSDPKGEGIMHHNLGLVHQMKKDCRGAMVHFKRALDLERMAEDEPHIAQTLLSLGNCHRELRDFVRARECFRQAYLHAIRADFALAQAAACQMSAEMEMELGEPNEALVQWQRLEKLGTMVERVRMTAYALNQQGRILWEQRNVVEARHCAIAAKELASGEDSYNVGLASLTLGEIALHDASYAEARTYLTLAQSLLDRHEEWKPEIERSIEQLQRAQGRTSESRALTAPLRH